MSIPPSPSDALPSTHRFLAGVWQRVFEEYPLNSGQFDRDTLVLWIQTPQSGIFIDLRLPFSVQQKTVGSRNIPRRPSALAATGYGDPNGTLSDQDLNAIQSFAGQLHVSIGDTTDSKAALHHDTFLRQFVDKDSESTLCTCFWERIMDYQPPSQRLDIGVCAIQQRFASSSRGIMTMRETGDDASYAEEWIRLQDAGSDVHCMALELVQDDTDKKSQNGRRTGGYWIRVGTWFAYAVGYPVDLGMNSAEHTGQSLQDVVTARTATKNDGSLCSTLRDVAGSYLALSGRIVKLDDGDNTMIWKIEHSTNPELVDCNLLTQKEGRKESTTPLLCCSTTKLVDSTTLRQTIPMGDHNDDVSIERTWKVRELSTGCALPVTIPTHKAPKCYGMDPHPDFQDLDLPRSFELPSFSLTPLSPDQCDEDFSVVTSSVDRLRGMFGNDWPKGLTMEENRIDLAWHEREFTLGRSFAWIVRRGGSYMGCAYVFPAFHAKATAKVVTWIRADSTFTSTTGSNSLEADKLHRMLNNELENWLEKNCGGIHFDWD